MVADEYRMQDDEDAEARCNTCYHDKPVTPAPLSQVGSLGLFPETLTELRESSKPMLSSALHSWSMMISAQGEQELTIIRIVILLVSAVFGRSISFGDAHLLSEPYSHHYTHIKECTKANRKGGFLLKV